MPYPLIVEPEAEIDLQHAVVWYNDQRPCLGQEFLECVEEVFNLPRCMENAEDMDGIVHHIVIDKIVTDDETPCPLTELRLLLAQVGMAGKLLDASVDQTKEAASRLRSVTDRGDVLPDGDQVLVRLCRANDAKHEIRRVQRAVAPLRQ